MPEHSYQPTRREFIAKSGLALAGLGLVPPNQILGQQTETKYSVKFQLLDDSDWKLQTRLGASPSKYEPHGVTFTATAEEIRQAYKRWQERGNVPDLSRLDATLEDIARQLKGDPNLLHRTFELKELLQIKSGVNPVYKMSYKRKLPDIETPLDIEFAGILRKGTSIEPILLMGYNIADINERGNFQRQGDLTSEVLYFNSFKDYREFRVVPKNDENEASTPLDRFTIPKVDATGIRRELLEGLIKQNLRYQIGLRPVVPK